MHNDLISQTVNYCSRLFSATTFSKFSLMVDIGRFWAKNPHIGLNLIVLMNAL